MSSIVKSTANQTLHAPVAKRTVAQLSDGSAVVLVYDQNIAGGGTIGSGGGGGGGGGGTTITSRTWKIQSGPMGEGTTIGEAAALSWVPGSSTNFATTTDIRQPVAMEMCFRIVSTAENSTTNWTEAYDYIEDIGDQRGYTGGLIGFTSATQDMLELVEYYTSLVPGNGLASYIPGLQTCSNIGYGPNASTAAANNLGNAFKTAWANAANNDPVFRRCQRDLRKEIYWDDALTQALADGVGPLGVALHYDVLVNHGPGNDSESYGGIIAAARASTSKPPSAGGNEANYLKKICDLRDAVLQDWGDYQADGRSTIFRALINANKLTLIAPYTWSVYGGTFTESTRPVSAGGDSVLGDYTLRYTANPVGFDDVNVKVNASGSVTNPGNPPAGTLSAGGDTIMLGNGSAFTRTASEPTTSGGGGTGGVAQPSDGTGVGKFYLYHSVNRSDWTLKATITPSQAPAVAGEYCIYSMTCDSTNNVHFAFVGRDNGSVRYYKVTTSGTGAARTYTAGSQETVFASPGIAGYLPRIDIDVLANTQCVLIGGAWKNGQNYGYRFWTKRLLDGTWVNTGSNQLWSNQTAYFADFSIAWDSKNRSAEDENGRTWFAVYCTKIANAQDFGDEISIWAVSPQTGANPVISEANPAENFNQNQGAKIRRGCLFSSQEGEFTLVGGVGVSNFYSYVLRFYLNGNLVVPYTRSTQTGINVNRIVGSGNDVGFAWQDYKAIVAYGDVDGRAYVHTYDMAYSKTPVVSTTNYALDNLFRSSSTRYSAWFSGGSNRFAWSNYRNLDMIIVDGPSGDTASSGARIWRHQYNLPPVAPKVFTPSANSQITSNVPVLTADLDLDLDYPQSKTKVVWQLARDSSFIQNVRTITQPDSEFIYLTMSGSTAAYSRRTAVVPADQALFTGNWYARAAFVSELGLQGPWSATQQFFVGHPPAGTNLHPSGDEFWTWSGGGTNFTWTFTDPAEGDYQTAYQIVIESADTGTVIYDTGKVASNLPQGTVLVSNTYKDIQLRWKLKLWDTDDTEGTFSDYQTFFLGDGPIVDLTSPIAGTVVATPTPTLQWDVDLNGWRILNSFRVVSRRILNAQVDYDSGWKPLIGAAPYSFTIDNPTGMKNDLDYNISVYVRDTKGLEGHDFVEIHTSWIPPVRPNFQVSTLVFSSLGYNVINWNHTLADSEWVSWRVYRRVYRPDLGVYTPWVRLYEVSTVSTSYEYRDWEAPANSTVQYAVVQVANRFDAPVESNYDPVTVQTSGADYWLINKLDQTLNLKITVNGESFKDEYEQEVFHVLGRGRHVDQGDRLGYAGSLTMRLRDQPGYSAREQRLAFEKLIKLQLPFILRSPFGDSYYVTLMNASYDRVPGMGAHEAVDVSVEYLEVAE